VLAAFLVPAIRVAPAFVVRDDEAGFAVRALRVAAVRAVPALPALPLFRDAAGLAFLLPAERLFLPPPVPRFAVVRLFPLPVFADFTPRGMSLLLLALLQILSPCDGTETD
jgi:hypothetical protein